MTFDRHDWKERCKRAAEAATKNKPSAALLAQAAVRAENLTGDPNWDTFTSYLTHELEAALREREQAQALWDDPRCLQYRRLLPAKVLNIRLNERIAVLEAVLALPRDIILNGRRAEEHLHTTLPAITE